MGCGSSKESDLNTKSPIIENAMQVNKAKKRRSNYQPQKKNRKVKILDQAKEFMKHEYIVEEDEQYDIICKKGKDDFRCQALKVQNMDIFENKLNELQGEQFTDEEFPPTLESFTRDLSNMPNAEKYQWTRVQEIYPETSVKIFQGKIEPCDIQQGELGNCYFLSALACLAERKNLIEKLFISKTVNDEGIYGIVMCIDGEFREIIIDDYIPTNEDGEICFSRSSDKDLEQHGLEIWVMLLEKAYAKAFNGYYQIDGGYTGNAIRDLTGAPEVQMFCEKGAEKIWDFLKYHDQKGHMLSTGTDSLPEQTKEEDTGQGVVSGHAYSILQVREVERDGLEKIIQIRNPWGNKEWEGDWSDQSSKWTEELKRELEFTDEDDGIFWIKVEDFVKQFVDVSANYVNESYQYNSLKLKTKKDTSILLKFNVKEDNTHAFIELTQKDQKHYDKNDNYVYSFASILCCSGDFQNWVGDNIGAERNLTLEGNFNKGTYIAWIDVQNPNVQHGADFITVSSYSDKPVQISEKYDYKSQKELDILDQILICNPPLDNNQIQTFQEDSNISKYQGIAGRYVYIQFVNNSTQGSVLNSSVQLIENDNLQIMHPYDKNDSLEVQLNPREAKIVKYSMIKEFYGDLYFEFEYHDEIHNKEGVNNQEDKEQNQNEKEEIFEEEQNHQEDREQSQNEGEENFDQYVKEAKKISKKEREEIDDWQVYETIYEFDGGYVFYYQNESDLTYQEDFEFKLTNLKIIDGNKDLGNKKTISPIVMSGEDKYFILICKDFSKDYEYDVDSTNYLY